MKPSELRSYFRALADEPDETFLTTADVDLYLTIGYDQFRQAVLAIDPYIYATTVDIAVSNARELDLTSSSPVLLGNSAATGARLMQLVAVEAINTDGETTYFFKMVGSTQALNNTRFAVLWRGQKLIFAADVTETLRITYLPEQNVTWADSTNPLDDLTMFHDTVGLFAYKQYAMRDGVDNPIVQEQLLKMRMAALTDYITARSLDGASYVARVGGDDYGWL